MSYDEIEGNPLTLLLFHERLYFPLLLDHAMQEGFRCVLSPLHPRISARC